ncbi:hypothetical protein JOB18_035774 [Solea senegalensis]|uniref:Cip1-interacting zinc finger protein-like isoform X1 n=1 Tax=Solea senegalensis TaxID=28829 RepID=A0AAV6QGX2_SOLSE|nr:cdkn1a interacting zinc finger protein 1b [Solea senegalensis]XP_043883089.1 cdkn1a interacting zinc finger protein 1b [Solea senegalensis]KAG7490443.1 cip1-interacting zinc finger protein-like isoform X1 [Solea senegalensis]KAG7490445.1 hypothetical protein JOB18_035774 [Solea senegalensis]
MVKQQRRTRDRCFLPASGNAVAQVRFPVGPIQRRPLSHHQVSGRKWVCSGTGSSTTTEGDRRDKNDPGPDGGSGETKRGRLDGSAESSASCDQTANESKSTGGDISSRVPPPDQQGSAEHSEDSRAAELQNVGSLKVTIQRSSENREFAQAERTVDRENGGLHCHVCNLSCCSMQVFQEHISGAEHVKKLQEITHSICLKTQTLQDRGHRPHTKRWCDTCQTHFTGDVIVHRRTKQHKMCKQLCRPFCPVCKHHFRTPRKFVEHMKSPEHKQQVHLHEAQEEELITVDAVGCFKGEEEDEEEEEEEEEAAEVADEEESQAKEKVLQTAETEDYNPHTAYGSSFVVPISGFLCRLCNKFFHRETTARHVHCKTHTHFLNLQSHRAQRTLEKSEEERTPALT